MKYRVIIQPPAVNDLDAAYEYVRERAPLSVKPWFDRFLDAIDSLEFMPRRCPVAYTNARRST